MKKKIEKILMPDPHYTGSNMDFFRFTTEITKIGNFYIFYIFKSYFWPKILSICILKIFYERKLYTLYVLYAYICVQNSKYAYFPDFTNLLVILLQVLKSVWLLAAHSSTIYIYTYNMWNLAAYNA